MKKSLIAAFVAVAAALSLPASGAADAADSPMGEGLVRKVDKAAGKVTIAHGPLPNGMPAMTMTFKLKEAAWAERIEEGQKIRFTADNINGTMTVLRFENAK